MKVQGIKATTHSSVTVKVGRESRTFDDGDGITFPKFVGSKRRISVSRVEFAGYGLEAPGPNYSDLEGKDYRDAAVVYLGTSGPKAVDADLRRRLAGAGAVGG